MWGLSWYFSAPLFCFFSLTVANWALSIFLENGSPLTCMGPGFCSIRSMHWLRDLDRFWRGLLSQCKSARAKQKFKQDLTYRSHKSECIGTTNSDRSVLITIITWHFQFHPAKVSNLHEEGAYVLEARAVSRALPLLRHVVPLNDGNCRLTIPVVKGRRARDALPHVFHIGVFKFVKAIFTAIKHIYKEYANIIEDCYVVFDSNDCWNFQ